jgi:hypothetical protein
LNVMTLTVNVAHRPAADSPWMKIEHRLTVIARSRFATRQSDPQYVRAVADCRVAKQLLAMTGRGGTGSNARAPHFLLRAKRRGDPQNPCVGIRCI